MNELDRVRGLLRETLQIGDRADELSDQSRLFGAILLGTSVDRILPILSEGNFLCSSPGRKTIGHCSPLAEWIVVI